MRFEWDETKNEINQAKHQGLDFEIATRVFADPNYVLLTDRIDEETGEQRFNAIGLVEATCLIVAHGRPSMAKKSSGSSQRGKLTNVKAEAIFNKPLTAKQKATLHRLKDMPDSEIDYSDIPALTDEQIAASRPARTVVAARLDPDVLAWLQSFGPGYTTRINSILRAVMQKRSG
jgi:uncharacterized protein (DUF4415 family)/uncharacterized DUF497 family protein